MSRIDSEPDYTDGATGDGWGGIPYVRKEKIPILGHAQGKKSAKSQQFFERVHLPMLSQAFIYEVYGGGLEEVRVKFDDREIWLDNIDADGFLHEAKTGVVADGAQNYHQLRRLSGFLENHPDKVLFYDFFASPSSNRYGPTKQFADRLADLARTHNIAVNIHPEGWWEDLQGGRKRRYRRDRNHRP